jgi:hypothetical protein
LFASKPFEAFQVKVACCGFSANAVAPKELGIWAESLQKQINLSSLRFFTQFAIRAELLSTRVTNALFAPRLL